MKIEVTIIHWRHLGKEMLPTIGLNTTGVISVQQLLPQNLIKLGFHQSHFENT